MASTYEISGKYRKPRGINYFQGSSHGRSLWGSGRINGKQLPSSCLPQRFLKKETGVIRSRLLMEPLGQRSEVTALAPSHRQKSFCAQASRVLVPLLRKLSLALPVRFSPRSLFNTWNGSPPIGVEVSSKMTPHAASAILPRY